MNLSQYKKYKVPALIGGSLLLLWYLAPSKNESNEDTSEQIDKEAAAAENQGIKLSYPLSNYNIWADTLQAAMFDAGTNESAIFSIFRKLKNPRDLLQLVKAFGTRAYYSFGWKQGDYNLAQWFNEELSESEIDEINSILKSNNIIYAF